MKRTTLMLLILFSLVSLRSQNRDFGAEFEKQEGILLTWDYAPSRDSVTANIAAAVQDVTKVWIIYYPGQAPYDTGYIRAYLLSRGVGYHNVHFLPAWTETLWIRDYGPFAGYRYTGEEWQRYFLDGQYSKYGRPMDDSIPAQLGRYWGIPVAPFPVEIEGGNVILDGTGKGFGSKRIWEQNASYTPEELETLFKTYFGLQNFHFLDILQNSGGGIWMHVDMYMKAIDNQTLLVSQYPSFLPDFQAVENIAAYLASLTNGLGVPYTIVRIPAPPKEDGTYATTLNDEMRTYTNALTINGVVLIPAYNHPLDNTAKEIYQELMPGYEIRMIDARTLTPLYGAIHCITKEIAKPVYLRIVHSKLNAEQTYNSSVNISCRIYGQSQPQSVSLFYKVLSPGVWQSVPMQSGPLEYTSTISGLLPGDTLSYYIRTILDADTVFEPLPAAKGPHTFWFSPSTAASQHEIPPSFHVMAESNRISYWITVSGEMASGVIEVFDLNGRRIYSENISGTGKGDLGVPQRGLYLVKWQSPNGCIHRKIFVP